MAGFWIGFRYYFGRKEVAEGVTLCFVLFLMLILEERVWWLALYGLTYAAGLTSYPVSFEAVLAAEVRFLSYLLAAWALQCVGVVGAICACAFAHRR